MTAAEKAAPTTGNGKAQTTSVWEELRRPFGAKEIEQREGPGGRMLDYVSHARVRDRLLQVDPTWTWEPMAKDENGQPVFERTAKGEPVGLWIRLMCNGISKPGYGDVAPGVFNPEKQLIGDALRNAALNFGVAIDLWIGEGETTTGSASSWPTRHETDGTQPQGPTCPTEGCTGHLRQRTTKKGDPFLVCDSYKSRADPGCGMSPIWETTIEGYLEGKEDFENVIYPEEKATPAPPPEPDYIGEIKRLVAGLNSDVVKDVILSLPQGHNIISPIAGGGWKVNGAALKTAGEAVQIEIIAALTEASG